MRLWVGTQEQLNALNNNYEDDVVYIVAEYVHGSSTTVPVTGVSISEGTRSGNNVRLTAVISPSNATDKSVTWTIDNTTDFSITPSSQSATLTVKDSATTAKSVTVTCTASNGVQGTLTLSLAYDGGYTAPTITQITYASAGENQLQFSATISDGSSIPVTWSASPSSVATIDASTGLLTILRSGTISVTATCANNTLTRNGIPVTYAEPTPGGEDGISATRSAANTMSLTSVYNGSTQPGATYSFVGTVPTVKHLENGTLADVPVATISGSTLSYKEDCAVTIQNNLGQTKTLNIVHDSGDYIWFEDDEVKNTLTGGGIGSSGGVTYAQAAATDTFKIGNTHLFQNNTAIRRFNELRYFGVTGIGVGKNTSCRLDGCTALQCFIAPSSVTSVVAQSLISLTALEEFEIDCTPTTGCVTVAGNPSLKRVKIGDAGSVPSDFLSGFSQITTVDFGTGVSELPFRVLKDTGLTSLTLRYNGKVPIGSQSLTGIAAGSVDLYVPDAVVSEYENYHEAIKEVHAITD